MSELNQQPGLFDALEDDVEQAPLAHEQQAVSNSVVTEVPLLDYLLGENRIRVVDVKLAQLLSNTDKTTHNELFYIVLLLCIAQQSQHSCLTLNTIDWANPFNLRQSDFNKVEGNIPTTYSPFVQGFNQQTALTYLQNHPQRFDDFVSRLARFVG